MPSRNRRPIQLRSRRVRLCAVPGCDSFAKRGSTSSYCNAHLHRLLKHGSPFGRAIRASELEPYRRTAARALRGDPLCAEIVKDLAVWLEGCSVWAARHPRPPAVKPGTPLSWRFGWDIARLHDNGVSARRVVEAAASVLLYGEDHPLSQRWKRFTVARHVLTLAPLRRTAGGNSGRLSAVVLDHLGAYLTSTLTPLLAKLRPVSSPSFPHV